MKRLRKMEVTFSRGRWNVYLDGAIQSWCFTKKSEAVAYARARARKMATPERGVSLRIKNKNGRYSEERTYPRSLDPTRTPG